MTDQQLLARPEQDAEKDDPADAALPLGDFAPPGVEAIPGIEFPQEQKQQREEPQVLDEPERTGTADGPHDIFCNTRHAVERAGFGRDGGVEVADHPVENEKADGRRNQQFAGAVLQPGFSVGFLQGIAGARSGEQEQQGHEPGIQDVHDDVLVLRSVTETADTSEYPFVVVEVDDVVQQHQQDRHPAQIVYPVLSHLGR